MLTSKSNRDSDHHYTLSDVLEEKKKKKKKKKREESEGGGEGGKEEKRRRRKKKSLEFKTKNNIDFCDNDKLTTVLTSIPLLSLKICCPHNLDLGHQTGGATTAIVPRLLGAIQG